MVVLPKVGGRVLFGDARLYKRWAHGILTWERVPYRDFAWEYPPATTLAILPPGLAPYWYKTLLVVEMLVVDLLVFLVLRALSRRLGSPAGVWLWVVGGFLLGPLLFVRYDSVAALLTLLAVLGLSSGAPYAAGFALGGGISAKLWPVVLLLAVPYVRDRWRFVLATSATLLLTVAAVLAVGGAEHGDAVFRHQAERGLQVESVAATPLLVMERAGADLDISLYRSSGSWDVTGTGTSAMLSVSDVATAAAAVFVLVLAWRVRRRPEAWLDLVSGAMLLAVVTGKVLSPQYLVWLLAVLAAALSRRGSVMTLPACLVAVAALLSQWVYPVYYRDLVNGGGLVVVLVLAVRNAELVAAACVAVSRLWRATRRPAAPAAA